MKPTLQEEIGMSVQGIEYVNSLEVKEPEFCITEEILNNSAKNDIPALLKQLERERVANEARNSWIWIVISIICFISVLIFNMS